MNEETAMIAVDKLLENPDNPRRETEDSDIEELAASIRANGVLQSLVVMASDKPGEYMLLAGHRRRMAAMRAGLTHVPCRIRRENIARADQIAMMVSENASRKGLRPSEEAGAVQLMLDLGQDMDSISAKTGFSKTKVRHRAGIAQLDQETLRKREADGSMQLSISDLVALEAIPDLAIRNEILAEAADSRDLAYRAQVAAEKCRREENLKKLIPMLEAVGIKKAPKEAASQIYDASKWRTVESIDLSEEVPEEYRIKEAGELFYYQSYRELKVIRRTEKKQKEKANLSEAEKKAREEEKQRKQNQKQLTEAAKEADALRRDFIMGVVSGKIAGIKGEEVAKAREALWRIIFSAGKVVSRNACIEFYGNRENWYEVPEKERTAAEKWMDKLDMTAQMLIVASRMCRVEDVIGINGEYCTSAPAERVKSLYAVLALFGLRPEKNTKEIISGKHPLFYVKPAPKPTKHPGKKKTASVKKAAAKQEIKKDETKPEDKKGDMPSVGNPAKGAQAKSVETAAGSAGEKVA